MSDPILIVDDDADILRLVQRALTHAGYAVVPAADGEQAIALLEQSRFALVITDLQLPGLDGPAIIARLRESTPLVPVIVMSGIFDLTDLTGVEILAKPFAITTLLELVQRTLP